MANSKTKSEIDYRKTVVRELEEFLDAKQDEYPQSFDHICTKLDVVWENYADEIKVMSIPELADRLFHGCGYYNGKSHPFVRR